MAALPDTAAVSGAVAGAQRRRRWDGIAPQLSSHARLLLLVELGTLRIESNPNWMKSAGYGRVTCEEPI